MQPTCRCTWCTEDAHELYHWPDSKNGRKFTPVGEGRSGHSASATDQANLNFLDNFDFLDIGWRW